MRWWSTAGASRLSISDATAGNKLVQLDQVSFVLWSYTHLCSNQEAIRVDMTTLASCSSTVTQRCRVFWLRKPGNIFSWNMLIWIWHWLFVFFRAWSWGWILLLKLNYSFEVQLHQAAPPSAKVAKGKALDEHLLMYLWISAFIPCRWT